MSKLLFHDQIHLIQIILFFIPSLSLALFASNNAGVGSTTGLPVADQELLEETISQQSDVPALEEEQSVSNQSDVPSLPDNN